MGLKVRALHDRTVVRDIVDLEAAASKGGFSFVDLEVLGRRHEPELDFETLVYRLGAVSLFEDEDYAPYGLAADKIAMIRQFATAWQQDLANRLAEQGWLDGAAD
ncbi:hypothetical protein FHU30_005133 [Actinomadura rupiterrae]|nr:hypothetical protein [Actinomadura rupiterrae]MCP2339764.1 hypothetical protein [Actinomadura rupiterrae]